MVQCKLEVYSHYFKIYKVEPRMQQAIMQFARGLIQHKLEKVNGRFVKKGDRVFATKSFDFYEFRFNRNQLEEFLAVCESNGVRKEQMDITYMPLYAPEKAAVRLSESWVPRDNQVPIIDYIVSDGHIKVVTLQTGQGKAHPNDTPIKVPGGWKPIGELKVGDFVTAADGTATKVIGVFPQGVVRLYRFTFMDGRTIETSGDHLWRARIGESNELRLVTTLDLMSGLENKSVIHIPLCVPEIGDTIKIPKQIVPDLVSGVLTSIPESIYGATSGQKYRFLFSLLVKLGWEGNEFGGVLKGGSVALRENIVDLVRSLGGIATNGTNTLSISLQSDGLMLVHGIAVDDGEATCIAIEHPEHLYVAKDYIVTHNTSCGLKAAEIISNRLGIVVLGRYFDKWVTDVSAQYRLPKNRLLAIRGYKQLQQVLYSMAIEPLDADVIIITSTTMQDYITHYEGSRFKDQEPWLVPPDRLWQHLGVGFRIIDEAHQHFHLNFTMDLYTHIPKALYLSATLEPDDPFIDRMYKIAYPMATRVNGGEYIKYCHVTAIGYRLAFKDKVRYKGFGGAYSHTTYEEWLMKKAKPLQNYLDLIYSVVENEYLNKREPGQKMLIFAGTVELCKLIRDDLKFRPRMKGVSIEKYTSEDPYEVIQSTDVVTTTLGSAGTAIDVPGLLCCLMTTSISGTQANLQAMGRLRELRAYPNSLPHFLYLYCLDIGKQVEYHDKKKRIFNGKVLSHREIEAAKII